MDKQQIFDEGASLIHKFCELNQMPTPKIEVVAKPKLWPFKVCAYYRANHIFIRLEKCAAIGTTGACWSYPGYTVDKTPCGVLAHELGHHFDRLLSTKKGAYFGDYGLNMMRETGEAKLTNYCPNHAEWFAEMFRLFVTNPDLLKLIRPKSFERISARFKPVETRAWDVVLSNAPLRTVNAATKKVLMHNRP